jgi:DNA-binding MarR family transcriptional regulator
MSRLVSGLERDGLATRSPHPTDGRGVVVEATETGQRVLEQGRRRRVAELAHLLDEVSADDRAVLARAAEIVERVSRFPPSASDAYAAATAERRWSGLADDSSGSGGASG